MPDTTTRYTHPLVEVNDLHVRFVTRGKALHFTKTNARPKFAYTTGN